MSRKPAIWQWFVDTLCSEVGQVESANEGSDLPIEAFEVANEGDVKNEGESGEETAASEADEDDAPEELKPQEGLPPEVEKQRAGMHRAYTKRVEKLIAREAQLQADEERAALVDKFYNDPQYANEYVQKWAQQNGYQLARAGAVAPATATQTPTANLPPNYVEAVRATLPEELQAFAPAIAQSTYAGMAQMLAPIQAQLKQRQEAEQAQGQSQRNEEVSGLMEELEKDAPGWQEHEDDMMEMLDFLESSSLKHKRFGSKAKLLLNLVTGNAQATNEVAERNRAAARHKGVKPQSSKGPNTIAERIGKAATDDEVWELAISDAIAKHPKGMSE